MNRIQLGPLAKLSKFNEPKNTELQEVGVQVGEVDTRRESDELQHSLFIPLHYESHYSYPLIVWLHPDGQNSQQIRQVLPQISSRNYAAVSIGASDANSWRTCFWNQTPGCVERAQHSLELAIDLAQSRLNICSSRVFLVGQGAGGSMAMRLAFRTPGRFAGVMSLGGALPGNDVPLANLKLCRQLPVFLAQGRWAESFDEPALCRQLRLLHVAGFAVTIRQYPCGESLPAQVYSDVNRWIMEQINESSDSTIIE